MRLLVAPDSSLFKTPDGSYWCPTIYDYSFFERYLDVFEEIVVASRVKYVSYRDVEGFLLCSGPKLSIAELPDMHGMKDYVKNLFPFMKASKNATRQVDCAIIRLPSISASMVLHYFKKTSKAYALEVVADPEEAYATNTIAKKYFSKSLRKECLSANGVSYVTQFYLQEKYPSKARINGSNSKYFESYYSTIRLDKSYYSQPRNYMGKKEFTIIHTSNNMNNYLKGHKELILSFKEVVASGLDVRLRLVGDGTLRPQLEQMVELLGISDKVTFVGRLSKSDYVRDELLNADLFVFPTKAEGLPRSLIEAMAVGLPCISSPVAGIPELLEEEDLVSPEDIQGIKDHIVSLLNNPSLMQEKSKRNIVVSKKYSEDILRSRRNDYYNSLKKLAINS